MIQARTPEAVLDFWLGPLRSEAAASRDNWRDRMLKWRVGPFARGAEDKSFFNAQRDWCEEIHREGLHAFFSDRVWETPRGMLAKLIVLDQFPRSVYRGTPAAYATDSVTGRLARRLCGTDWYLSECNGIERFWTFLPLSHPEEIDLQEMCVRESVRWSEDLVAGVSSGRRRINQYIGWYFIKAFIEHADALMIYGRFPHRNAILGREHKPGEPHYLKNPVRPLWSFTQPPRPEYYAILGALHRIDKDLDEEAVRPEFLAKLVSMAKLPSKAVAGLMKVFDPPGDETVSYMTLYRRLVLRENERAFRAVCRTDLVGDLFQRIKRVILNDPEESWPPKSAMRSVRRVVDVTELRRIVIGARPPAGQVGPPAKVRRERRAAAHGIVLTNDSSELERLANEVNTLAASHGFAEKSLFEIQLALEEWVMNTINYGFNDAAEHEIHVDFLFDEAARTLVIDVFDDGRRFDPLNGPRESDLEAFLADRVEGGGVGVQLVLEFTDRVEYRRRGVWNHVTLTKRVQAAGR
ncbi:MAG: DUF924 family protein [Acidobacteria bacterium]|nr:DUF924 family protein [Acidobacteriota bacterium]